MTPQPAAAPGAIAAINMAAARMTTWISTTVRSVRLYAAFTAAYFQSKGDPITDLSEDMAAEQKARTTYENLIRLADDPDVLAPLRFLREREIVHYQRFGEALRSIAEAASSPNYYAFNPAFDL